MLTRNSKLKLHSLNLRSIQCFFSWKCSIFEHFLDAKVSFLRALFGFSVACSLRSHRFLLSFHTFYVERARWRKPCERSEHATENPKSARRNDTFASKKCSKILHFHEKKTLLPAFILIDFLSVLQNISRVLSLAHGRLRYSLMCHPMMGLLKGKWSCVRFQKKKSSKYRYACQNGRFKNTSIIFLQLSTL